MHILRSCKNCEDFDVKKEICTIRYTISKDKTREPMKRKPKQNGCEVFMYKIDPQMNKP